MKRPRFTIAGLLAFILFLGIGLAALRGATDEWDSGVFGLTLALFLISVARAVHRTGDRRAYWLGFALFGGAYLFLSLVPPIESRLPTTRALAYLDSKVADRPVGFTVAYAASGPGGSPVTLNYSPGPGGGPGNSVQTLAFAPSGNLTATGSITNVRLWNTSGTWLSSMAGSSENFVRIGHSLLALVLGMIGAYFSRSLHASGKLRLAGETGVDQSRANPSQADEDSEANPTP
jgi:hypothetical protein